MSLDVIIKNLICEEIAFLQEKLKGKFNMTDFKKFSSNFNGGTRGAKRTISHLRHYADKNLGEPIGAGSSRRVWALSGNKVLKLAIDYTGTDMMLAGIAQNRQEVELWTNPKTKGVVAKIYDFDPNYLWVISEIVNPINYSNAMNYIGMEPYVFAKILDSAFVKKRIDSDLIERVVQHNLKRYLDSLYETYFVGRGRSLISKDNFHGEAAEKAIEQAIKLEIIPPDDATRTRKNIQIWNETKKALKGPKSKIVIDLITGLLELTKIGLEDTGDIKLSSHYGKTADGRIVLYDYGLTDDLYRQYY